MLWKIKQKPGAWVSFGIFVAHRRAECVHYRLGGKVFTCNELESTTLTSFFLNKLLALEIKMIYTLHDFISLGIHSRNVICQHILSRVGLTLNGDQWSMHVFGGHYENGLKYVFRNNESGKKENRSLQSRLFD